MEVLFAQLNVVHGMLSFSVAKTPFRLSSAKLRIIFYMSPTFRTYFLFGLKFLTLRQRFQHQAPSYPTCSLYSIMLVFWQNVYAARNKDYTTCDKMNGILAAR